MSQVTPDQVTLKGVFDMHVHSAPDIRERAYTDFEMMDAGIRVGAKGIVLKSHHGTTMNRAFLCNEHNRILHQGSNDFVMYGSITLNYAVGGLNPVAVETALKMGAKVVWLPTMHAKNQLERNKKAGGIECLDAHNKLVPSLVEIFKMIQDADAVLGTGHLSPQEIFPVVEQARNMGLRKVVITHPEFWVVGLSHEEQVRLVNDYDVILERCYAQPLGGGVYKSNLEDNLAIIKLVGYRNVMVDTDGGQVENPHWELALQEYMQYLFDRGVSREQLWHMTHVIPARLLGSAN